MITKHLTNSFVGSSSRNHCTGFVIERLHNGDAQVLRIVNRSMRDPVEQKGPSHRPDYGRSYKTPKTE